MPPKKMDDHKHVQRQFIYFLKRIMPDEIDEDGNFNGWVRYVKNEETKCKKKSIFDFLVAP